jgi:hypothetical protein
MKIHLFLTIGLAAGLMFLVSGLVSDGSVGAQGSCDRYVVGGAGSNSSDCSDESHPCKTVQYAIDHAADGDVICVADLTSVPGPTTYHGTLLIDRSLTLDGKWQATCAAVAFMCSFASVPCAPENVVLDADGAGRVIKIVGDVAPTVDCFTITGGDAAGLGGDPEGPAENDAGGGIYSRDAAPIIINNVITANYGCDLCPLAYGRGGGVYLLNAPATAVISGNLIANNVADNSTWGQGGGIMVRDSDAQIRHNTIQYNRAGLSAGYGGGIVVKDGMPTVADNDVVHNVAGQSVQGLGGGIFVWSSSPAILERNTIEHNQAISGAGDPSLTSRGGGICYIGNPAVTATIRDNTIHENIASPLSPAGYGGGIYVAGLVSPSLIEGNILDWNYAGHNASGNGGGIYVGDSEVTILDNDFTNNSATWAGLGTHGAGGGIFVEGGAALLQGNSLTNNYGAGFPGLPSTATGYGGGIAISNSLTIVQDNWIVGNRGTNTDQTGTGGGIYGFRGKLQILGNTIGENKATPGAWGFGGGIYLEDTLPTVDANTILNNIAADGVHGRGGGVRLTFCSSFTLTNNIIAENSASELGSGIAIAGHSNGDLAHNTLADNWAGDGVGIHVSSSSNLALYNNIISGHTTGIVNADLAGSSVGAKYTLFEANTANYGAGVSSSNEVDGPAALLADYHLAATSGAIDHAPVLSWVSRDIDGDHRPLGAASDVGADEYALHVYLPLVLRITP